MCNRRWISTAVPQMEFQKAMHLQRHSHRRDSTNFHETLSSLEHQHRLLGRHFSWLPSVELRVRPANQLRPDFGTTASADQRLKFRFNGKVRSYTKICATSRPTCTLSTLWPYFTLQETLQTTIFSTHLFTCCFLFYLFTSPADIHFRVINPHPIFVARLSSGMSTFVEAGDGYSFHNNALLGRGLMLYDNDQLIRRKWWKHVHEIAVVLLARGHRMTDDLGTDSATVFRYGKGKWDES